MKTLYLVLAALVSVGFGKKLHLQLQPQSQPQQKHRNPELKGGFVEGDLKLTAEQKNMLFASSVDRSGLVNKRYRWPKSVVWFKFSPEISKYCLFIYLCFFFEEWTL